LFACFEVVSLFDFNLASSAAGIDDDNGVLSARCFVFFGCCSPCCDGCDLSPSGENNSVRSIAIPPLVDFLIDLRCGSFFRDATRLSLAEEVVSCTSATKDCPSSANGEFSLFVDFSLFSVTFSSLSSYSFFVAWIFGEFSAVILSVDGTEAVAAIVGESIAAFASWGVCMRALGRLGESLSPTSPGDGSGDDNRFFVDDHV